LGCGGVCRWVEAIDRPAVGYTGECRTCDDTNLPREQMIPLEFLDYEDVYSEIGPRDLAKLTWDNSEDWETNQEQLAQEVIELAG
jgi:hypothetical protein